ncbi:MAG: regulatory protein RecX [Bacillota bacterium]
MLYCDQFENARKAALKYLAYRARTEFQVAEMLYRKGYDEEIAQQVVSNLKEYGFLNDEDFAENYVRKRSLRPRAFLEANLNKLGLDKCIIERALNGVDPGAELRVAMSLAIGKKRLRGDEYPLVNIAAFLRRRGFSQETIERVCSCLENMPHP